MKMFFPLALACLCFLGARGQTVSVDILDANVTALSSGNATANLYVSDTDGLVSLELAIGSQPDSTDVYSAALGFGPGGSFYQTGTVSDGVLSLPLSGLSAAAPYYARFTLYLTDNSTRTISVVSQ